VLDFCFIVHKSPLSSNKHGQLTDMSILLQDMPQTTRALLGGQQAVHKFVPMALSINHGAPFALYASDFLCGNIPVGTRNSSLPAGVASLADQLKGKLKRKYLEHLQKKGMDGLQAFLAHFISSLST
jgi:hypothetical protein